MDPEDKVEDEDAYQDCFSGSWEGDTDEEPRELDFHGAEDHVDPRTGIYEGIEDELPEEPLPLEEIEELSEEDIIQLERVEYDFDTYEVADDASTGQD